MQSGIKTSTNIKIPLSFILFGLAAFVFAQWILFVESGELVSGQFRIPAVWMSAHLLILGFCVMIAMGAMYQLVPVAFLTPVWNQTFGFIQFFVTASGIAVFSLLLGFRTNIAVYGGALAVIGVLMFIFQMIKTLQKQKTKNVMSRFVCAALLCFLLTITAGFLLAWNLSYGGILKHDSILYSHITFGTAGWFTNLIFGFSYKLVPMFSLSHGFSMKWAKPSFLTYTAGLTVTIIAYWANRFPNLLTAGFLLLFLGFLFFVLDMKEILDKRMKKQLDEPFVFSLTAIANGFMIHILAALFVIFGYNSYEAWSWLIYLYITTWILFSILGYLYKIVPFLWWTHKYSDKIGKEKVPTLKDMMNIRLGVILYWLFIVSTVGIIISVSLQSGIMLMIFQGLFSLTSVIYVVSIIHVLIK